MLLCMTNVYIEVSDLEQIIIALPSHIPHPYLKADILTFPFPESFKIQFKNVLNNNKFKNAFNNNESIAIDSNSYKSIGSKC